MGQRGGPVIGSMCGHVDRLAPVIAPISGPSSTGKACRYGLRGVPDNFRLDIKGLTLGEEFHGRFAFRAHTLRLGERRVHHGGHRRRGGSRPHISYKGRITKTNPEGTHDHYLQNSPGRAVSLEVFLPHVSFIT